MHHVIDVEVLLTLHSLFSFFINSVGNLELKVETAMAY